MPSFDLFLAFLAGTAVDRLRRSGRAQRVARMLGGGLSLGLGGKLAFDR